MAENLPVPIDYLVVDEGEGATRRRRIGDDEQPESSLVVVVRSIDPLGSDLTQSVGQTLTYGGSYADEEDEQRAQKGKFSYLESLVIAEAESQEQEHHSFEPLTEGRFINSDFISFTSSSATEDNESSSDKTPRRAL
jgi:hypothetical protein